MIRTQVLSPENFQTSSWSGGRTTELYCYPETSSYQERNFDFRLSTAQIELEKSQFTYLPNYKRLLMSLNHAIHLKNDNGKVEVTLEPYSVYAFDGGDGITCQGRCQDFNLIYSPKYQAEIIPIIESIDHAHSTADFQFIYALTDLEYQIDDQEVGILKANDLLLIQNNYHKYHSSLKVKNDRKGLVKALRCYVTLTR